MSENKSILQIAVDYLSKNGYDGLYNSDMSCGCETRDIAPCERESIHECKAGYKFYPTNCEDEDCNCDNAGEITKGQWCIRGLKGRR